MNNFKIGIDNYLNLNTKFIIFRDYNITIHYMNE